MEINRNLIDFNFGGHILYTDDTHITQFPLESGPLSPLQCNSTMRKSEWDSLVHYNCLTKDPFSNDTLYFINNHMELIRIKHTAIGVEQDIEQIKLFRFPPSPHRVENVSLSIPGNGLILYCDGNGKLLVLKEDFSHHELIYECEVQKNCQGPLLLLASSYRDEEQCVQCAAAQKLELPNGDGMTYRLWLIELCNSKPNAPSVVSDVSMGAGLIHTFTELALTSSLPTYCCFEGPDLLIHVENSYILMVESADTEAETENISCADSNSTQSSQSRDGSRTDLKEIMGRPRYGIGYECDGSNVNSTQGLDPLTSDLPPLDMRFQKASDVLNECINARSDIKTNKYSTKGLTAAMRFQLENPTIESILGDVEECDATKENSFGTLLLFNCTSKYLSHHLRYNALTTDFWHKLKVENRIVLLACYSKVTCT
uniref:Uncharacterized protein AlNc14C81G5305 n=1 Tax=Albugo laibachii Nc14 TaxID=890382 RepID=F0WFB5_9STRA|nr:conserved hypothetical protein [Albugo laibachii Nc14]|eukprot:CCA19897.1 conserved hypothetical protein [Albugo laibachii Nc14]